MSRKELLFKTIRATLGISLTSVGIYLLIQANIGVNPWDVFTLGIVKATGMLYGNVSILVGMAIVAIDLLLKEKIGIGTLLDVLVCGKVVDLLNWLDIVPVIHNLWLSLFATLAGIFILCVAQYLYMREGIGCGPRDALQMGIGKKLPGVNISLILGMIMGTVLIIGWLLGGQVGIGTLMMPVGCAFFQQLVFKNRGFDPKSVRHIDIIEAGKILFS